MGQNVAKNNRSESPNRRQLLTAGGMAAASEDANREAWECPACGRGSARSGNCPLDGATLEHRADGADVAVHGVLSHGGTVLALGAGALVDADGIGAVLRF